MAYSFWKEFAHREPGRLSPARCPAQSRTGSPGGFYRLYSWGPEDCLAAPPGPPPPALFGGTPLRHRPPCGGRLREGRSPSRTNLGSRSTKCRVRPGAGSVHQGVLGIVLVLTTSPDAWSFPATPPRPRWRQGSSLVQGSSSFLTP